MRELIIILSLSICVAKSKFVNLNKKPVESIYRRVTGDLSVVTLSNDMTSIRLRRGNTQEETLFEDVMKPYNAALDSKLEHEFETREEHDDEDLEMSSYTAKHLQRDILKSINDLMLSRPSPDSHLNTNGLDEETPAFTFYLKHHKTMLSMTYGNKQFYYIISLPWQFPPWFYKDHTSPNDAEIEIPDDLKMDFLKSLDAILKAYLPTTSRDVVCVKKLVVFASKKREIRIVCLKADL